MTVPELVAPGVYCVDAIGPKNAISVLLLENDDGWTLVDTGVAGSVDRIKEALTSLGSGPEADLPHPPPRRPRRGFEGAPRMGAGRGGRGDVV